MTFLTSFTRSSEFGNTHILSIGSKGLNHEEVISRVEQELLDLRDGKFPPMYSAKTSQIVIPVMFSYVRHGDQPERLTINGLKLGQNTNHTRWGYSVNYKDTWPVLKSCSTCRNEISEWLTSEEEIDFIYTCQQCTNWEVDTDNKRLHHIPPKHFPNTRYFEFVTIIGA